MLVHGLFDSLDSLGIFVRDLVVDHNIVQVDMRNHGLSPRSPETTYLTMVQDLFDTFNVYQIECAASIDHLMGGKAVMVLIILMPEHVSGLVAIDIASVDYYVCRHDEIFTAIRAVSESSANSRQQMARVVREHLRKKGVAQSLLKSFVDDEWHFNMPVLWDQCLHIADWETIPAWPHPMQFILGDNSPYVTDAYRSALLTQFLQTRAYVIAGAGHWVHAEKPEAVLYAIRRYLASIAARLAKICPTALQNARGRWRSHSLDI